MHVFTLALIAILTSVWRLPPRHQDPAIGSWCWTYSDREGRPSKCDCDYIRRCWSFSPNGKASYQWQRGRLDPEIIERSEGTWQRVNDSTVLVRMKLLEGTRIRLQPQATQQEQAYREQSLQWHHGHLWYDGEEFH